MSKFSYDKDFFESINTEEKAYWLGFVYADGCVNTLYKDERLKSMNLEISLKEEDGVHLELFNDHLKGNLRVKSKTAKVKDKTYGVKKIVVSCTKMCRDLIDKGCTPRKSLTLTFPENTVPQELIKHFIRGYFDGDGCVHYSQSMVFHKNRDKEYLQNHFSCSFIGTKDFLTSLAEILKSNNIKTSEVYGGNSGKAFELRIYGQNNILSFYQYLYTDSTVKLTRKFDVFNRAFETLELPL